MQRYSYLWFLLGLIGMLIVAPIAQRRALGDFVHQGLFTIVVLLALNTVSEPGARRIAAVVFAAGWLIISWVNLLFGAPGVHVPAGSILFCLFAVVMYNILLLLFRARETDANVLSAAIAAYFMLGVAWAVSFDLIERIAPGSFRGLNQGPRWTEFLYFSMGTLTTVGYNNITPTNASAGIWATLEAACGVLYVAVLISHLVARVRH
jgi:ABC-type transport system involved in multi-copper enzyme maturation permease subunit